jgi:hypothetical protein
MAITDKSSGLGESRSKLPTQAAEIVALGVANHDDVAALAYRFWQRRGCPIGSDQEDWFRAEQELRICTVVIAHTAA